MDTIVVDNEDAIELSKSIIETEASHTLLQTAQKSIEITPDALRLLYEIYMSNLKRHKLLWMQMLIKYIGENNASTYQKIYRFDMYKKIIFKITIEGCSLCHV